MHTNTLYRIASTRHWMLDPMSAAAALALYKDMAGAARLKAAYPIVQYEETDNEAPPATHYFRRLTHADHPEIPKGHAVNVARLEGIMLRHDTPCQPGTSRIAQWIRQGDRDPKTIGTILHIDSGGGAADSVRELAEAIKACEKPVTALSDGNMCSAAYYAASYCSRVMAHDRRDLVGCIGTMIELQGYPRKSTSQDGLVRMRIYADGSEEKNSEYEKALDGDEKPIRENLLNPMAEDFRNDVKANRPAAQDTQLKGRTYFAQDTIGTLTDAIGGIAEAVSETIRLSKQNITKMQGFKQLQSLATCHDLTMVDGHVTLDGEQIAEINAALEEAEAAKALTQADAQTITEQADQISRLEEENYRLRTTANQLNTDNAELRTQLAESNHDTEENHQQNHIGNPMPDETADSLSPMEYAKRHEEMFHS